MIHYDTPRTMDRQKRRLDFRYSPPTNMKRKRPKILTMNKKSDGLCAPERSKGLGLSKYHNILFVTFTKEDSNLQVVRSVVSSLFRIHRPGSNIPSGVFSHCHQ